VRHSHDVALVVLQHSIDGNGGGQRTFVRPIPGRWRPSTLRELRRLRGSWERFEKTHRSFEVTSLGEACPAPSGPSPGVSSGDLGLPQLIALHISIGIGGWRLCVSGYLCKQSGDPLRIGQERRVTSWPFND
jgi:hypothetical protein